MVRKRSPVRIRKGAQRLSNWVVKVNMPLVALVVLGFAMSGAKNQGCVMVRKRSPVRIRKGARLTRQGWLQLNVFVVKFSHRRGGVAQLVRALDS
jgi:hypothetical protein